MTPSIPGPEGHRPSGQQNHLASDIAAGARAGPPRAEPGHRGEDARPMQASAVLAAGRERGRSDFRRIRRDVIALALLVIVLAIGVVVQSSLEDIFVDLVKRPE